MTATNYLYLIAMGGLAVLGWETQACAESDVTIVSPPAAITNAAPQKPVAPDGTPVVHKSSHKKKTSDVAAGSTPKPATVSATGTANKPAAVSPSATTPVATNKPATASAAAVANKPVSTPAVATQSTSSTASTPAQARSLAPMKTTLAPSAPIRVTQTPVPPPSAAPVSTVPTVETALPIARHAGSNSADNLGPIPPGATLPANRSTTGTSRQTLLASTYSPTPAVSSNVGLYSPSSNHTTSSSDDFPFANFNKKVKNTYPWKTGIITTMFYIGEGGSSISPTDNMKSSWDGSWVSSNHGTDTPYNRNGYAAGNHASTVNPFYVALPFNDLAFPDKAREWLPAGWHRPNKDGKPVSACKDRWVEIKTEDGSGHVCYAQWEDVGPLRYDHAEYVFGSERPDTYTRAGLDVSPAVADYLGMNEDKKGMTRWRFVDDEDVPPGVWLKYDEQALLYSALQQLENHPKPAQSMQRDSEPIDDPSNLDSNKKKVGAAKG